MRTPNATSQGACRTALATGALCAALSGCAAPPPVVSDCEEPVSVRLGIGVAELRPAHDAIPEGSVVAFGRIAVAGAAGEPISLRLVRYVDAPAGGEDPYAEQMLALPPDGRFNWILPKGQYSIHALTLPQGGEGGAEVPVLTEFRLAKESQVNYLGALTVVLAPEPKIAVEDERARRDVALPAWSSLKDRPVDAQLMRYNPELATADVGQRRYCRRWSEVCWDVGATMRAIPQLRADLSVPVCR
jgi:hypothetical protein